MIGAKPFGQFESMLRPADDDHASSTRTFGHSQRRNADWSGTLDDHTIAPANACPLHSMNCRDERATGANERLGRQIIG